jgi:hypothetical protein
MRPGPFAATVLCVAVLASPVAAQPHSTAKADQLFNEGRALLDAGKFKEACAKFQASLDESDALGTRMNLALCMEKRGRVHSALVKFEDTAARADRENQPDSARVARDHADKLRLLVPRLTIKSTPVPGQRIVISRPGEPDVEVNGTEPVQIDPTDPADPADKITITATAPGYHTYASEPRTVAQRATDTIVIPELGKADGGGSVIPGPRTPGKSSKRKVGLILGITGGALMVGGTIYGYLARERLNSYCASHTVAVPPDDEPDCVYSPAPENKLQISELNDGGRSRWKHLRYYAPTVFFVGVAAVGVGAYLFFTAPKSGEHVSVVPTVDPQSAGITVVGRF